MLIKKYGHSVYRKLQRPIPDKEPKTGLRVVYCEVYFYFSEMDLFPRKLCQGFKYSTTSFLLSGSRPLNSTSTILGNQKVPPSIFR